MKQKLIAFCGNARSGKDTFGSLLKEELKNQFPEKTVKIFRLADAIREDLKSFFDIHFGISPYTQENEEKEIVRPIFIAYGNAKRKLTNNEYFIRRLENELRKSDELGDPVDIAIITDLRFGESKNDEIFWLKNRDGKAFFIERTKNGRKEKAPNEFEKRNEAVLKKQSEKVIRMERFEEESDFLASAKSEIDTIIEENLELFV